MASYDSAKSGSMTVDRRFLCSVHISAATSDVLHACQRSSASLSLQAIAYKVHLTCRLNFVLTEVGISSY